ncbi:hypothetical protein [Streptomyces sp. NPDC056244]|uniref:hypothetical protein n=1 Tax=Streptomyces sp. NPDC056244 TaxID=3345762 RepID=UPI0035D7AE0E
MASPARRTIAEQFAAFDQHNPWVYRALEDLTAERLAGGATRIGMKALFEVLRWRRLPHRMRGLNNNYTSLYARKLIEHHPHWAPAFELRRRRTP